MDISVGVISVVGQYSYHWSHVLRSATTAYGLGVNPTDVNPSGSLERRDAFPLRCLYLGSV